MIKKPIYWLLALGLSGCSTIPSGPSVLVLPGTGKDYARFHLDDVTCRKSAQAQIEFSPNPPSSWEEGQQRYDVDYIQCMYGEGHRVPVPQGVSYDAHDQWHAPPPPNLPPPSKISP